MKTKDNLKYLKKSSAKISNWMSNIEESFVEYFGKSKYLYSRTNLFGHILSVIRDISSIFFSYHEDAITEINVHTAQKEQSLRHFASISGLSVTYAIPSTGAIRLELKPTFFSKFGNSVFIRRYAALTTENGALSYLIDIKDDVYSLSSSTKTYILPVIQGSIKQSEFISDGTPLQMLTLNDPDSISTNHIRVFVDGVMWNMVDSLYDMILGSHSYMVRPGFQEQIQIIFGNGLNGKIPAKGSSIKVEYLTTAGEAGNIKNEAFPEFKFVSGVFDGYGDGIDIKDECTVRKELGFVLGSNGDSIDTLRTVIGLNSRGFVIADTRAIKSHLSSFSFLSKISVWTNDNDRRINHIMVLPNLYNRLESYEDYFTVAEDDLIIDKSQKDSLLNSILQSSRCYISTELVWVKPKFIKYALFVYLDYIDKSKQINTKQTTSSVKEKLVHLFIENSFSTSSRSSCNIPKSIIIKTIQEEVGVDCRVSCIIMSQPNEEAKINGFYYKKDHFGGSKRIEVEFGIDPFVALNERNDIVLHFEDEIPLLRGGFLTKTSNDDIITIDDPITFYVSNANNDWDIVY